MGQAANAFASLNTFNEYRSDSREWKDGTILWLQQEIQEVSEESRRLVAHANITPVDRKVACKCASTQMSLTLVA